MGYWEASDVVIADGLEDLGLGICQKTKMQNSVSAVCVFKRGMIYACLLK